jgi:hypothetical protein
MQNVATITDPQKVTAEQALEFADAMGKRGQYNPTTARLFRTALQRFIGIMAQEESKTAQAMLDHLEDLCDRWARLNNADPRTARQYKARARLLLTDFIAYVGDPTGFKGRGHGAAGPGAKKAETPSKKRAEPRETKSAIKDEQPSSTADPGRPLRSYPLGDGRDIDFRLPQGGIKWSEVAKFALHLLTMATDFDPTVPEQARMFAIVKRGPE